MAGTVVQVYHEVRQLQDLEVQDDVPEDHLVVPDEVVLEQDLVALLRNNIGELLVQLKRWQQLDGVSCLAVYEVVLALGVDFELWNELLVADRALAGVAAEVALEPGQQLLFT